MDGLIKNLVEPARSEEDLPASAVTEVPLSEIMQTCVQTFIPLAESKNKESMKTEVHAPGFHAFASQIILFHVRCRAAASASRKRTVLTD